MRELDRFQAEFLATLDRAGAAPSPFTVYRNTGLAGAIQALADNYPVVSELLGAELFHALAADFAGQSPPDSPVLAHYGAAFPAWLAQQPIAAGIGYLADVARCERVHIESVFAADAPVLEPQHLAGMEPDALLAMKPALHPATRFAWFATPAVPIWLAHRDPVVEEIAVDWLPSGLLLCRPALDPFARAIDRPGLHLLRDIRGGAALGAAAAASLARYPDADIGGCFGMLVAAGAFTPERTEPCNPR